MDANKQVPLVVIRCITYNQEKYIRDALDGFVMQKTNFPFVAIVHDDASTDRTADVIREYAEKYPDIIIPILESENQYSKHDGSLAKILNNAIDATGAKYVAMCEGDDYWTDSYKLQKQVDFLESHPDYGMCYTYAYVQKGLTIDKKHLFGANICKFEELLTLGSYIPTLTTIIRKDLLNDYQKDINPSRHNWKMGDFPMWLYFAKFSKIKFLPIVSSVYRELEESASHTKNVLKQIEFNKSFSEIKHYFNCYYNSDNHRIKNIINFKYAKMLCSFYILKDTNLKHLIQKEIPNLSLSFFQKLQINLFLNPLVRPLLSRLLINKIS